MPLPGRKTISRLDLNKNIATGVAFPYDGSDDAVFKLAFTEKDQIKSNLINLLLTEPGERIYEPDYGLGLKSLMFENDIDQEALENIVHDKIEMFIPDITLIGVDTDVLPDDHIVYIKVSYQLVGSGEVDAIQINYNSV